MIGRFLEWFVTGLLANAFPSRYRVVPRIDDGLPMLRQFKLFDWCYLQSFYRPDQFEQFHIHRWRRMFSIVLSGSFVEERYPGFLMREHRAGTVYSMDHTVIHRIASVAPRTWTLFFMLGNSHEWGYYSRPLPGDTVFTDWKDAVRGKEVKSL